MKVIGQDIRLAYHLFPETSGGMRFWFELTSIVTVLPGPGAYQEDSYASSQATSDNSCRGDGPWRTNGGRCRFERSRGGSSNPTGGARKIAGDGALVFPHRGEWLAADQFAGVAVRSRVGGQTSEAVGPVECRTG